MREGKGRRGERREGRRGGNGLGGGDQNVVLGRREVKQRRRGKVGLDG